MNFAHTRVGRNPLTTASGVLTLAVVGFGGGRGDGASEDRKIERERPILDVEEIELDRLRGIELIPSFDLTPTGQPGLHLVPSSQ